MHTKALICGSAMVHVGIGFSVALCLSIDSRRIGQTSMRSLALESFSISQFTLCATNVIFLGFRTNFLRPSSHRVRVFHHK